MFEVDFGEKIFKTQKEAGKFFYNLPGLSAIELMFMKSYGEK